MRDLGRKGNGLVSFLRLRDSFRTLVAILLAACHSAHSATIAKFNMDSDPGWTIDTGEFRTPGWAFGTPTGGGGQYGSPDPTSGHTGANVYGYNLGGDYENNLFATRRLTTTAIDCTHYSDVHLSFWRWLGVEQPADDHANVEVSSNGSTWTVVWQNSAQVVDAAWTQVDYDISAVASQQPTVYVRWGLGPTNSGGKFCGWNIDDIALTGNPIPPFVETYRFERMWPNQTHPWYFYEPKSIAVDSSGNVYVADTQNNRIQKFDASGRFITKWGRPGSGEGQFTSPQGVAIDASGNVYVADTGNHRVQKFTETGEFLDILGSYGAEDGQFSSPGGLAVDASGSIYVADTGNHRVQKFHLNSVSGLYEFTSKWGSVGSGAGQFSAPEGIAVDTSGNVYVADTGNDRIQRLHWNPGTEQYDDFWTTKGSRGSGRGQFWSPKGIAADSSGSIHVCDTKNGWIQKFSATAALTFLTQWGGSGSGDGQFYSPTGAAIDPVSGSVYVADLGNNRVQEFQLNSVSGLYEFITKWSSYSREDGRLFNPGGIAVDSSRNVYVADTNNNRIQKFTASGTYLTQWGVSGAGDGQFRSPQGVAVDDSGNVYVADTNNHRIQKFTASGGYLTQWGIEGSADGRFLWPHGVGVDTLGNVHVADTDNDRIQSFTATGGFLAKWDNGTGSGDKQLNFPTGVTVDALGYVYVSDSANNRIIKLDWNPSTKLYKYEAQWGRSGSADGEFLWPRGIAVDDSSNVYVADKDNHRIQKFNSGGALLNNWGGLGSVPGRLVTPLGVAVDDDGQVYLAEGSNHRIQVFRPVTLFSYDKAVIVAGRKSTDDYLWPATQKVTLDAYRALNFRGIAKEQIRYLSHNTQLDIDDNLLADDVYAYTVPIIQSVSDALTTWAKAPLNGLPIENVVVFLADHGGPNEYTLSEDVTLTGAQLNGWLNTLEAGIQGSVTVVLEACESGSFLASLKKPGRTVVASTRPEEAAYFQDNGVVSFSGFFWQQMLFGRDLKTGFTQAVAAVNTQHPQVDADGDGTANEAVDDLDALAGVHIGSSIEYATAFPTISSVEFTGLSGSTATLLANDVRDTDGSVARVFAKILPPGSGTTDWEGYPILSLPEVTLDLVPGTYNYQISYNGFTKQGVYNVTFYAMDNFLYLGEPKSTEITVDAPRHRRAVLVAGGSLAHQQWPAYARSYGRAYGALKKQRYADSDIMIMAHSNVVATTEPVTVPTLQGLTEPGTGTLRSWVGTNTQDLTIYLVGPGADDLFQLNDDEYLTSTAYSALCTTLQLSLSGTLVTVIDACSAGSFANNLGGTARILVTSTGEGESARFVEEDTGIVSFSEYFWTRVGNGDTVELAISACAGQHGGPRPDAGPRRQRRRAAEPGG